MAATIRNPGLENCALPYPFRGILKPGQVILLDMTVAAVSSALGGDNYNGALDVTYSSVTAGFDTFYEGDAATDPLTGLSLLITGDGEITGDLDIGDALNVAGTATISILAVDNVINGGGSINAVGDVSVGNDLTVTGDIVAKQRQDVGPFAEALAATQTDSVINFGGVAVGWVARRAGSLTGLSGALSTAITGAGTEAVVSVAKNGTVFASSPTNTFTADGTEVKDAATAAIGACTFVADDVLTVIYTSTAIGNTPTLVATIEVTC